MIRRRDKNLVLVTGTPRSGTTAVGDVLSAARGARELYEPFNRHVGMVEVDEDFPIPGSSTCPRAEFDALVDRIAHVDLRLRNGVFPHDQGWRRAVKYLTGSRTTMTTRVARVWPGLETIVWKDPFAVFAAGAVRDLGVPVLVTVRNPWAMAASFKRLAWGFDAQDVARRLTTAGRPPAVDPGSLGLPATSTTSGALNWLLAHESLLGDLAGGGVHLVDLDAVIADPLAAYEAMYALVGLAWTDDTAAAVQTKYAASSGSAKPTGDRAHVTDRDLTAVNSYWSDLLDAEEVAMIDDLCGITWDRVQEAFAPLGA